MSGIFEIIIIIIIGAAAFGAVIFFLIREARGKGVCSSCKGTCNSDCQKPK